MLGLTTRKKIEVSEKVCRTCKEPKPIKEFSKDLRSSDGRSYRCRTCHQDKAKTYRASDMGKATRKRCSAIWRKKYMATPEGKLRRTVSGAVREAMKKNSKIKTNSVWVALPYSPQDLRAHLESLFVEGMCWENYGEWHMDHRVAQFHFKYDSVKDPEFQLCWALNNLQPMWATENIKKGTMSMQEYSERKQND